MSDGVLEWGVDVVLWLQRGSPQLDWMFDALSGFGSGEFLIVLVASLYWAWDRRAGLELGTLLLISASLNGMAKLAFDGPRPYDYDVRVLRLDEATGGGLPSGHVQAAVVLWGWLAAWMRTRWAWIVAGALAAGVGVSRMYLGAHFPTDVVGGVVLGVVVLVADRVGWPWIERRFRQLTRTEAVFSAAILSCAVLAGPAGATLAGVALGVVLERRAVGFGTPVRAVDRVVRLVVGLAGLGALWEATSVVGDPQSQVVEVARYAGVGLWVTLGAPWCFRLTGVAGAGSRPRGRRSP